MASVISDKEAQCRNLDNTSVYDYKHKAAEEAITGANCVDRHGNTMALVGGGVPPSRYIDVATQLRGGADTVTTCKLYRPGAAQSARDAVIAGINTPLPKCAQNSMLPLPMSLTPTLSSEYSLFRPGTLGLPILPSGTIVPGIDTRRELKDAWKSRNPAKPNPQVTFVPGKWTGPYGSQVNHGPPPVFVGKGKTLGPYNEILQKNWQASNCPS